MPEVKFNGVTFPNCVTVKSFGGDKPAMASISQQLSPFLIAPKKVSDEIALKTKNYPKIRCVSYICIDAQNKYEIHVPLTCSMLLIQELGSAKRRVAAASAKAVAAKGKKKKTAATPAEPKEQFKHTGDLKFAQIEKIAQQLIESGKFPKSKLPQAITSVLGTASTLHCTIDQKTPKEALKLFKEGAYS